MSARKLRLCYPPRGRPVRVRRQLDSGKKLLVLPEVHVFSQGLRGKNFGRQEIVRGVAGWKLGNLSRFFLVIEFNIPMGRNREMHQALSHQRCRRRRMHARTHALRQLTAARRDSSPVT